MELVVASQLVTADCRAPSPVSLKFSSAHSDRDGPAVINPEAGVTPAAVIEVVVVVVVAGAVVVVPPPPPFPPTGAEVVGVTDVALPLPPGAPVTAVVFGVGAVDSVIGEGDVSVAQYFVRPTKRLLPNQKVGLSV